MSVDADPFDELGNSSAFVYGKTNTGGLYSTRLPIEPTPDVTDLNKQIQALKRQLAQERLVSKRLMVLNEFGKDLETAPNPERSAKSMAKLLQREVHCELVSIFDYYATEQRFKLLAAAGPAADLVPLNFVPEQNQRVINLAIVSQRLVSSQDMRDPGKPLLLGDTLFPALLAVPILQRGKLRGLILLANANDQAFQLADSLMVEFAAARLESVWDFSQQNETLIEFVQTISMMSVVQEAGSLLEMAATLTRQTLGARYVLIAVLNQQEWLLRSAGQAPKLAKSLQNGAFPFLEEAAKSPYTFRLLDITKDERSALVVVDSVDLNTLLACPIRISGASTGVLLAFGKVNAESFSDTDVFLAELLVSQTTVNLESCYLNQELRGSLKTTQLLYDLSQSISKAENLQDAVRAIARTTYRLLQARQCGLVLISTDGRKEAEVRFPTDDPQVVHPINLINQAMDSRQTIYLSDQKNLSRIAIPIQTLRRCYGALWVELSDDNEETRHPTEEIRILVNQAAVALERAILLEETRYQANEIAHALQQLEGSYEELLYGLTKALDARDRETEGHSIRVEELSQRLGVEIGLTRSELQALKRGALLHDIGKIGVPDGILRKHGPLDELEWHEMRKHPQKGAEIVQEIPALQDALPVIAFHQERWNGSGYPLHLRGKDIPALARIFAVVDVFDALTSNRPYREAQTKEEALDYLEQQAGILFDPEVVLIFTRLMRSQPHLGPAPLVEKPHLPFE